FVLDRGPHEPMPENVHAHLGGDLVIARPVGRGRARLAEIDRAEGEGRRGEGAAPVVGRLVGAGAPGEKGGGREAGAGGGEAFEEGASGKDWSHGARAAGRRR